MKSKSKISSVVWINKVWLPFKNMKGLLMCVYSKRRTIAKNVKVRITVEEL